ncbi:LOW QUALITY PROTEIN: hypothetical protein Cgig2_005830 [Carnegiea gigantea]|uniref:Uncharacterized protein n=1 Tax=Carnegiea gigantea TaxID=171969 RepID=A0A9Q1KMK7_9CARY|nr:LOW QUALITY PROTEIN: hypothetical protein Cgig2_005830 [Carnegiea gigantea]
MEAVNSMRPLPTFTCLLRDASRPAGMPPLSHHIEVMKELKKALYELKDQGQIDRFLKRGPRSLWKERDPAREEPREEECSTEIVATITGGGHYAVYMEGPDMRDATSLDGGARKPYYASGKENCSLRTSHFRLWRTREKPYRSDPAPTAIWGLARNLEVDFLVVDVPMTYNVILGRLTLYRVKAVIASYLLELQYKADDGRVMKL